MSGLTDGASGLPSPRLRPYIRSYSGYRLSGFAPGTHIGMPSPYLTVIITIGEPLEVSEASHPDQRAGRWSSLASGISATPCTIVHDGNQHGVQLALTPIGARALFGIPTAAIGAWMVDLDDVLGRMRVSSAIGYRFSRTGRRASTSSTRCWVAGSPRCRSTLRWTGHGICS